jgi:hypothetical protein
MRPLLPNEGGMVFLDGRDLVSEKFSHIIGCGAARKHVDGKGIAETARMHIFNARSATYCFASLV